MRKFRVYFLIVIALIAACSPETGSNLQKEDKGMIVGDKFFMCWPESISIKPGYVVDTIATQIPSYLSQVVYVSSGSAECAKTDSVYKDDRIKIERIINNRHYKLEYCSEDFSSQSIQLFFISLDDPSYNAPCSVHILVSPE